MQSGDQRGPPRRAQTSSPSGFAPDDHPRGMRHGKSRNHHSTLRVVAFRSANMISGIYFPCDSPIEPLFRSSRRTYPTGSPNRVLPAPWDGRVPSITTFFVLRPFSSSTSSSRTSTSTGISTRSTSTWLFVLLSTLAITVSVRGGRSRTTLVGRRRGRV
jgi:hypothetical protein